MDSSEPSNGNGNGHWTNEALTFCSLLPKIELHAHLNGSVRDETIRQLVHEKQLTTVSEADVDNITSKAHRTLADCFRLFDIIHACTTDLPSITRITREVIHDFCEDRCVYLELRTTPKARLEHGVTKRSYIEAVLAGMKEGSTQECNRGGNRITVRLLLSIDRREGAAAAMDTVHLAKEFMAQGVVGIDLSGNPSTGVWAAWEGALGAARAAGLRITLHGGEVEAAEEGRDMIAFGPERLGHMCVMDEETEAALLASRIPVELCLTSNIKTQTFKGYDCHHFRKLHAAGHPVVLCTDDSGVFGTNLSHEYAIAMTTFGLTRGDMKALVLGAVDHCFLPPEEKQKLRVEVKEKLKALDD